MSRANTAFVGTDVPCSPFPCIHCRFFPTLYTKCQDDLGTREASSSAQQLPSSSVDHSSSSLAITQCEDQTSLPVWLQLLCVFQDFSEVPFRFEKCSDFWLVLLRKKRKKCHYWLMLMLMPLVLKIRVWSSVRFKELLDQPFSALGKV